MEYKSNLRIMDPGFVCGRSWKMDSRSCNKSIESLFSPNPRIIHAASNAPRKPRAHPEPVGQNGCCINRKKNHDKKKLSNKLYNTWIVYISLMVGQRISVIQADRLYPTIMDRSWKLKTLGYFTYWYIQIVIGLMLRVSVHNSYELFLKPLSCLLESNLNL